MRSALTMIALSVGLWVLFLSTLQNRFEHPISYLPLPIGSLVLLWAMRARWKTATPVLTVAPAAVGQA